MAVTEVSYEADGWGVGKLWLDDARVLHHELPTARSAAARGDHWLARRLQAYFAGERVSFDDVALDVDSCTPFQRAVTDALQSVPYGETVTYGELAALAGYRNAHRAVGGVCARNRFPVIVPCHRVVASTGPGRFGSLGTRYKERLLELERAT